MPRLKGKSARQAIKPEDILLDLDPFGETGSGDLAAKVIAPRHMLAIVPKVMVTRIEKGFEDPTTRPEGFTVYKAVQFADWLVTRDIYLKQREHLRPQDRHYFSIHQKSLEDWTRDKDGNKVGDPPIGMAIGKLIAFFIEIGLLKTIASKTGKRSRYIPGKASAQYCLDETVYAGGLLSIQIPFKGSEDLPEDRVLERAMSKDQHAQWVVENLRKLEVDWNGLRNWFRQTRQEDLEPVMLVELRKVTALAMGRLSLSISDYGRYTHNLTGIQGGVRAFVGFKGYGSKVELDLSSSHSTLFYMFLRDLLRNPPQLEEGKPAAICTKWWDHYTGNIIPSNGLTVERLADPLPIRRTITSEDSGSIAVAIALVTSYLYKQSPSYRDTLAHELSVFREVIRGPGGLYKDAQDYLASVHGYDRDTVASIDNLKVATLAFYCGPNFYPPKRSNPSPSLQATFQAVPLYRYFKARFPTFLEVLLVFKHRTPTPILPMDKYDAESHKVFARLCMNLESEVILQRLLLLMQLFEIPCVPIHDGVEVPMPFRDQAKGLFDNLLRQLDLDGHMKVKEVNKANPRPFRDGKLPKVLTDSMEADEATAVAFDPAMAPWRG